MTLGDEFGAYAATLEQPTERLRITALTLLELPLGGTAVGIGTIEKGKITDLVLLDANPLDDISNTKRIAAVVLNGRYLSKESREKMLADVEAAANRVAVGADKPGKGRKYGSAN